MSPTHPGNRDRQNQMAALIERLGVMRSYLVQSKGINPKNNVSQKKSEIPRIFWEISRILLQKLSLKSSKTPF
jgi:hypothetical protein